ncbi:DUF2461 family protein [Actinopolymorpha sp. B11F2]|uniref:DUF2461 family protein n=1 Tax=Actinopolymorpha sp. B11F2 TaxID=3160862 RepID=UPI0032E407F9
MAEEMTGLPESAYDVLLKLDGEPSSAVLDAHRTAHDQLIRRPMEQLAAALDPVAGCGFCVSGRSGQPRSWQRTNATAWIARRVRMTVEFDLDGLTVEGGWSGGAGPALTRYREAAAADGSGEELAEIAAVLDRTGYEFTGRLMTRPPRGYPPDHPRADLLRRRSAFAQLWLGAGAWVHTPEVVDRVRDALVPLLELTSWVVDHVAIGGFAEVD